MNPDLRQFIDYLERNEPGHIIRIKKQVDPRFELTGILAKLEREKRFPAIIFENVKGSSFKVVSNIHGDFARLGIAMGMKGKGIQDFIKMYSKAEDNPIEPKMAAYGPVKEVVWKGSDIDLYKLPIATYHEKDAAPYVTAGFGIMKDPDSGVRNAGIYRLMLKGRDKFGIQLSQTAHGHYIWKKNEKLGKPTEMAVVIGHHPLFYLGCLSFTPLEVDEYAVAGALLGEPLELVKCETLDLEVPAYAEMVLECEIVPHHREDEAPFGEFPGTYGPKRQNPIVMVKAITMRSDAYYQDSFVGHPDNLLLSGVTRSSYIFKMVKVASPKVKAVHMPLSGRCRFICYIALENIIEGEAKNAAMAAFAVDPFLKFVIVVDDDVDIMNDSEVLHAIATRVRADRDTFMITYAKGSPLDPSSYDPAAGSHLVTKMGIDATRKANYPEEIKVPGVDAINLEDYI